MIKKLIKLILRKKLLLYIKRINLKMPPTLLFFDWDQKMIDEIKDVLEGKIEKARFERRDVRSINADVFVSPANSYGYMDGGIDDFYERSMWPEIGVRVRRAFTDVSHEKTIYGRKTLSIGSALIVHVGPTKVSGKVEEGPSGKPIRLISAPTMELPHNIEGTPQNVYYAMYAIFKLCQSLDDNELVAIPGMGTGVGGLSGRESAEQILRAYMDLKTGVVPEYPEGTTILDQSHKNGDGYYYVYPKWLV